MNGLNLTNEEVAFMANVIAAAMERGAIKANEAMSVGTMYNKLAQHVANVQQATQAEEEPSTQETVVKS